MIEQITGKIATAAMRQTLLRGETITIPSLGIEVSLSNSQMSILNTMKPRRWYFTLVKFAEDLEPLVTMGFLETKPNPRLDGFAYRRVA